MASNRRAFFTVFSIIFAHDCRCYFRQLVVLMGHFLMKLMTINVGFFCCFFCLFLYPFFFFFFSSCVFKAISLAISCLPCLVVLQLICLCKVLQRKRIFLKLDLTYNNLDFTDNNYFYKREFGIYLIKPVFSEKGSIYKTLNIYIFFFSKEHQFTAVFLMKSNQPFNGKK